MEPSQITSLPQWAWPRLSEVWKETLLPALEGVAGIFDNATTTYPLSVLGERYLGVDVLGDAGEDEAGQLFAEDPWRATAADAAKVMLENGFRHVPIVEDGRAVGIVSIRDVARWSTEEG